MFSTLSRRSCPCTPGTILVSLLLFLSALANLHAANAYSIEILAGTGKAGFSGDDGPATEAELNDPSGLCRGPDGAIYVCDVMNHRIRKIGRDGLIRTVAGNGHAGRRGDGGPATEAELNEPYEIRFDKKGNMFFVERMNHQIRRVEVGTGRISTIAGDGRPGFLGDGGPAIKARMNQPHSLQFDSEGNLYVCDILNHRIRIITMKTGEIRTLAGTGEKKTAVDGSLYPNSPLNGPRALDFDRKGNLWLALREGNAILKLDPESRSLARMAGTGEQGFSGAGKPAVLAKLSGPKGVSVGPDGNVYFADTESHTIRMLDRKSDTVELICGTGEKGDGPFDHPLLCKLDRPHGIFADANGDLLVGDSGANRVLLLKRRPAPPAEKP